MAGYNLTRTVEEVLEHFEKDDKNLPSLTVHLHPEYWTLNNGSKFLYNNPVASLLDDIRAHRIPVDFLELFDSAKVPFYDGCMIVELLDYRPQKLKDPTPEKPERTRVVLHPNSETLWADICLLNQKTGNQWTDQDALEIEARLLLVTAPPLCLDPDPHLTRIVNNVLRASTPTVPVSLKRKATVMDPEEDETDKARRAKLMQFMNPRQHRSHAPNYRILEHIQRTKMGVSGRAPSASPQPASSSQTASASAPSPAASQPPLPQVAIPSPTAIDLSQQTSKKKTDPSYTNDNRSSTSGSTTPVSAAPVSHYKQHLQPNNHPSSSPASPMQPARAAIPTQQQYPQPTQVPSQTAQPLRPSPAQHPQRTSPVPNFQGLAPQNNFQQRSVQPKPGPVNVPPVQGTPQQANAQQQVPAPSSQHAQLQQMYPQYPLHMQPAAQRPATGQNQNGRATPQGQPARNSMNANGPTPQRGTQLVSNQGLHPRSPMPTAPTAPAMAQHLNYHAAIPQSPYNLSHLRPMPNSQHLSSHMVNGGAGGPSPISQGQQIQASQDQQAHAQMMPQFMFNYPQMSNYPQGRLHPGYGWSMGRGAVNSQHQMPGIASNGGHPQQMLNVGKAVQGNMQGR